VFMMVVVAVHSVSVILLVGVDCVVITSVLISICDCVMYVDDNAMDMQIYNVMMMSLIDMCAHSIIMLIFDMVVIFLTVLFVI